MWSIHDVSLRGSLRWETAQGDWVQVMTQHRRYIISVSTFLSVSAQAYPIGFHGLSPDRICWRDPAGKHSGLGCHFLSLVMRKFISVQLLSPVQLFTTQWIAAHQASLSITNSGVYSNSCRLSRWCHPAISSSVIPFSSCPQSLPASGSFPMSQLFAWGGQGFGVSASASVLPMNTLDWSPLGWTGWISLQSKGLSRVFSNTTVLKHQFFSFTHSPTLTCIHDLWKNHSLDQTDLCWQSNVSAF